MTSPARDSNTTAARDVLAALEQDATREAGLAFLTLAAEYLAATATGEGPVSPPVDPAAMAARFAA